MPRPLTTLVSSLADVRAKRAEQRRLRDELASYSTPAERADLEAVLARQTPEVLEQLARQAGLRSVA